MLGCAGHCVQESRASNRLFPPTDLKRYQMEVPSISRDVASHGSIPAVREIYRQREANDRYVRSARTTPMPWN